MSAVCCLTSITAVEARGKKRENSWEIGGKKGLRTLWSWRLGRAIKSGTKRLDRKARNNQGDGKGGWRIERARIYCDTHRWTHTKSSTVPATRKKKWKATSVVIFFLLDTVSLDRDLDRTKLEESNYKRLSSTLFVIPWRGKRKLGQERKRKRRPER